MDQSLQPSLNTSAPHHASLRPGALKESVMRVVFCLAACACILAVALICVFLFANGLPFFAKENALDFLLGQTWKPGNDIYGILPMILGSIYITAGAIVLGAPIAIFTSLYMAFFAPRAVLGLLQGGFRVATDWAERDGMYYMELNPQLEGWGYLGALAALGLVFALCAFLLLKHREMERSGDVIAVGWLRPVALYVFTIGCALVLGALMAELFSSNTSDNFWYVLLFSCAGAFLGYFTGKMLLHKTIHVFQSGWLGLGACCLVLLLAFGAAEFDLFGYSRYLPERSAVQAAGLTHYQSNGLYTTQDDAFIQDVLNLHTAAVSEKSKQEHRRHAYQLGTDYTEQFYITYRMTDGTLTERYYSIVYSEADLEDPDSLISRFSALYNSPVCVRIRAGFDTPRTEKSVLSCYVSSYDTGASLDLTGSDAWRVYEACLDDINAGLLGAEDVSGSGSTKEAGNYTPLNLIFTVTTQKAERWQQLYTPDPDLHRQHGRSRSDGQFVCRFHPPVRR